MIVGAAKKAGKLDAICLSLHGAAVTETEDDAEGALLEALRGIVGTDMPDRRHARPACQCHAEDGEARQRAGELSHLSAHRRLRARGAGRGAGAGGAGGQEEAALPAGPAGHAGRRRPRPHDAARPDARPAGQGRCVREGAGHQRGQRPGGLHLGRHSLYRPVGRGELRAGGRGARQGEWRRRCSTRSGSAATRARRTTGRSPTRLPRPRPASARTDRWSWPTAPTIRAAAATTTRRRCCRR